MKRFKLISDLNLYFLLLVSLAFFITSFSSFYNNNHTKQCNIHEQLTDTLSFTKHVFPIIEQKCASKVCHGGEQYPTLMEYKTIRKQIGKIRFRLRYKKKPMPPLDAKEILTEEEKEKILTWISKGAKHN